MQPASREFVVLGGGVMGLSVARELAQRGVKVTLIEKGSISADTQGAATWASLGVLGASTGGRSPWKRLQSYGYRTYPALAVGLLAETGMDIGYSVRGSLHLKSELPRVGTQVRAERLYREAGLEAKWLASKELSELVPGLFDREDSSFRAAFYIASEAIVHPPSLARALKASCERRGVRLRERSGEARLAGTDDAFVEVAGERIGGVGVVLCAGCWSRLASNSMGYSGVPIRAVRGQAIEVPMDRPSCPNLRFESPSLRREYQIVSKGNGLAWVGSTVEDAGFDPCVTSAGLRELIEAARRVLPDLREKDIVRSWAGLRPQALRPGGPFLGRVPGWKNVWVASGHYRSGILTGPASARLLVQDILGEEILEEETGFDREALAAFRVER